MVGFAYWYRTHAAAVSGTATRRVDCCNCRKPYDYQLKRTGVGGGHAPLFLGSDKAAATARERAQAALNLALRESVEPVMCPTCGWFQPDMIAELRQRLGEDFDPNAFAFERIRLPFRVSWDLAERMNTPEAYLHLIHVWPHALKAVTLAHQRIRDLRRSPFKRWLLTTAADGGSLGAKLVWAAIAVGLGTLVVSTMIYR